MPIEGPILEEGDPVLLDMQRFCKSLAIELGASALASMFYKARNTVTTYWQRKRSLKQHLVFQIGEGNQLDVSKKRECSESDIPCPVPPSTLERYGIQILPKFGK